MEASPSIAGWRRILVADGAILVPPEGDRVGRVRIRLREPRLPAPVFAEKLGAAMRDKVTRLTAEPIKPIVTLEGEHAVLLTLVGSDDAGHRMERTLGIIYGDEHAAVVDGIVQDPEHFVLFRQVVAALTTRFNLGLGDSRRRMFAYDLPTGWQGLRRHHTTTWLAPGYPRRLAAISVFDARPRALTPWNVQDRQLFEDLSRDFVVETPLPAIPVATRHGLSGQIVASRGRLPLIPSAAVLNCALDDGTYIYFFRLECASPLVPESLPIFQTTIESSVPVPHAETKVGDFIEWQD